jgi:probable DNA repair protein
LPSLITLLDQGRTVLCASRRLAHALRLSYAHFAQQQGRAAWRTPEALPWTAWLRQQWLDRRAASSSQRIERLLIPAQARALWESVIGDSSWSAQILNVASTARLVARSWQRLHDYLIPLDALDAFEDPESQALLAWCREFQRRCEALGVIDEARLSHWADRIDLVPVEPVALAGFDVLTPSQARLVARWRAADRVIALHETQSASDVVVRALHDTEAELRNAAAWARRAAENGAQRVGIIAADVQRRRAEVERVFTDVFAPNVRSIDAATSAIPVAIAAPQPLASYAMVDAALAIIELACLGGRSALVGKLLRTPFIAGAPAELSLRALADVRLRNEQRDEWNVAEFERWAMQADCDQLHRGLRELAVLWRAAPRNDAPSAWAERFQLMLQAIEWPGERVLDSVEHQTLVKFQSTLAEFGSLDLVTPRISMQRAFHALREICQNTSFEPQGDAAIVTIIDPTTVSGMTFDALWVLGMDSTRMPGAAEPDAFIPLELQRKAGIPEATAAGVLKKSKAQLQRWVTSAQHVVLSWPQHEGDAELSMSPLLDAWATESEIDVLPRSLRELAFANRPALDVVDDARAPMLSSEAARGGAAILELQSRCPFKAQAQLRLGAKPLKRVVPGVMPMDRGNILHDALKDVWADINSHANLQTLSHDQLAASVRSIVQRHVTKALQPGGMYRSRLAALEVDYACRQILTLLELERQRPAFAVRSAEHAEPYAIGGLELTIRPDRIDELPSGGELLIDYKLGASNTPRDWLDVWDGRPRRPQLPLYALAHLERVAALAFVVLAPGKVEYRGWSNGSAVGGGVTTYQNNGRRNSALPMDWLQLLRHWEEVLLQLATRYVTGHAEVDPLPQECTGCDLSILCRIHERTSDCGEEEGSDAR